MRIRKSLVALGSAGMIMSSMPITSMADIMPSTAQENVETVKDEITGMAESEYVADDGDNVECELCFRGTLKQV